MADKPKNIITSTDIDAALSVEFIKNFNGDYDRLAEILGIFGVSTRAAGTALYQYTVSGSLNNGVYAATSDQAVVEGKIYYTRSGSAGSYVYTKVASPKTADIATYYELTESSGTAYEEGTQVALSNYTVSKSPIGDLSPVPYRKMTTAKAILQDGYEAAVLKTDAKMVSQIRAQIIGQFFAFLANGTGAPAEGVTINTLQKALAYADAALENAMETNGDQADGAFVHFINRNDAADYLANATITTQTMFGMTYIQDFLGVQNVFLTNKIAAGDVYVTHADNIHAYGIDFGELADGGLVYQIGSNGLIGVAHKGAYDYASAETNVMTGLQLIPEVLDYIVKATINPS